ncbi:family 43 glycosylhydrolase [Streptomyces sp. NPDC058657]|uniref:glycoside hydrolase family 43 protein n=1 Tax=unclassified Streptomyces TaxID=2593676 RepID=UPI0036535308
MTATPRVRYGDLGDGTYRNPVLHADYSDPDVIAVGDDFYLTASSFGRAPGLPLLHSRDLVNWTLLGHALDRLEPAGDFTAPRHDRGVWAPSLRYAGGRFWIFWGDPDHGIQQINSPSINGPWTPPYLLKAGKGLIDACPLWDEETGEAYLVHAWAKSRSGVKNRLTGHRMSPDGRTLLDEGTVIVDGDRIPGWFTLEGPKLYRRDGWYWILAPAGGVDTGWQGAFRSSDFFGPYEERIVLAQGTTDINGPHQGGWVRTPAGEDWFLHFQSRGAYGRVVHLQPVRWGTGEVAPAGEVTPAGDASAGLPAPGAPCASGAGDDGWPEFGAAGEPVRVHRKPALPPQPATSPATGDTFPGGRYGPQWSWTANPAPGWTHPHGGDGLLLACVPTPDAGDLRLLPHVLTQRLPDETFTAEVTLALEATEPGARAGFAVLGDAFSWIGLERGEDGSVRLVHRFAESVAEYERDAAHPRPAPTGRVRLRIDVATGARCRFHADTGAGWRASGPVFAAQPWRWVGALLGLFALAPAGTPERGTATFTDFRITPRTD